MAEPRLKFTYGEPTTTHHPHAMAEPGLKFIYDEPTTTHLYKKALNMYKFTIYQLMSRNCMKILDIGK